MKRKYLGIKMILAGSFLLINQNGFFSEFKNNSQVVVKSASESIVAPKSEKTRTVKKLVRTNKVEGVATLKKSRIENVESIKYTYGEDSGWNPCEDIKYILSEDTTQEMKSILEESMKKIEELRMVKFKFMGYTTEVSSINWGEELENNSYRPVLISFTSPKKTDVLGSGNAGGAVVNRSGTNPDIFVSGTIAYNRGIFEGLKDGFTDGASKGNLILHELGHLVGLGHVDVKGSLMYPILNNETEKGFSSSEGDFLRLNSRSCKR